MSATGKISRQTLYGFAAEIVRALANRSGGNFEAVLMGAARIVQVRKFAVFEAQKSLFLAAQIGLAYCFNTIRDKCSAKIALKPLPHKALLPFLGVEA